MADFKLSAPHIKQVPPGQYTGVCTAVVDVGTLYDDRFEREARKIALQWELIEADLDEDCPPYVYRVMPARLSRRDAKKKTALTMLLADWLGRQLTDEEIDGFTMSQLAGLPAAISIGPSADGSRSEIKACLPWRGPKGAAKPAPSTPPVLWSIAELEGAKIPENVPAYIASLIRKSKEYQAAAGGVSAAETETPF